MYLNTNTNTVVFIFVIFNIWVFVYFPNQHSTNGSLQTTKSFQYKSPEGSIVYNMASPPDPDAARGRRAVTSSLERIWPNGVIPFVIGNKTTS